MFSHLPRDKPATPAGESGNKLEPIDGLSDALDQIAASTRDNNRGNINDSLTAFWKVAGPTLRRVISASLKRKRLDGPDRMLEEVGDVLNQLLAKLWKSIDSRPSSDSLSNRTPDEQATGWVITITNRVIEDFAKTPRRRYWAWKDVRDYFQQRQPVDPD